MMLSILSSVTSAASTVQSGQGGSTEVIARIETEAIAASEATQPLPTQPYPIDDQPIQTGEMIAWFAFIPLLISGTVLIVFRLRDHIY